MIILPSTSEFKIKGTPYPGFPLLTWSYTNNLLDTISGQLFEEGHEFLIYDLLKRGRVQSKETWKTYSKHLVSFFSFCEDNEQNWLDIEDDSIREMLVSVYRDACIHDDMKPNSINQHLRTVIRFYEFALGRGWINSLPYSLSTITVPKNKHAFLAHIKVNSGKIKSADIMLQAQQSQPKFLSSFEVQELLKAIKNPVLQLMVRLALQTGIRKKELILFPLDAIRKPIHNEKICKVSINRTKGEKERIIHVPQHLMNDLWIYVNELRHQQQQHSGTKTNHLFLNTNDNRAWIYGSNGLNKALNDLKLPFKVTPHKLRHTYACHMLKGLMAQKNTKFEPLMYLQRRLGHSSITTTMIYLDIVNDMMDGLTLEYQEQINNICDTGDIA